MVVGTLGRGTWRLVGVDAILAKTNRLYGAMPSDLPYELHLCLDAFNSGTCKAPIGSVGLTTANSGLTQTITVTTTGTFTLTFGGKVNVVKTGKVYTVTFDASLSSVATLTGDILLTGTVARATTSLGFAANLQAALNATLRAAGLSNASILVGLTQPVTLAAGTVGEDPARYITMSPSGVSIDLHFFAPIKAQNDGNRVSLVAPGVTFSLDPAVAPVGVAVAAINVSRRVEVNVRYTDAAFQELRLSATPTRFQYDLPNTKASVADPVPTIALVIYINGLGAPISYTPPAG